MNVYYVLFVCSKLILTISVINSISLKVYLILIEITVKPCIVCYKCVMTFKI